MTRREKILLQICIAIALVGLTGIYLLKPSIEERREREAQLEMAQLTEVQIRTVLDAPGVEETYEKQKKLAHQNYQYFYDELNTYTIDGILNNLIEKSELGVDSINIGAYVEIAPDTLMRDTTPEGNALEMDNLLLGCNVSLTVTGTYENILKLIDSLETESTCIEVTAVNLYQNERSVEHEGEIQASLGLLVYGINDVIQEEEGL